MTDIRDVTIVGNGAGFSDESVRAFFLFDSARKTNRSNRGVGLL
jgi:hypothetical protein